MKARYVIDAIMAMRQAEIALRIDATESQRHAAETRLIDARFNLLIWSGIENIEFKIWEASNE